MYKVFTFLIGIFFMTTAAANGLTLTSTDFANNSPMPVLHTCDANDISPELNWDGAPANTKSFALIVADPDAPTGTFYHWVVFNIPRETKHFDQNAPKTVANGTFGKNTFGELGYKGPCPPQGTHHYIFTLYALDSTLNLPSNADAAAVLKALQSHILEKAELAATYKRK
jgi:Raf kinase inhibitor-like YbhB/YbcL family protein